MHFLVTGHTGFKGAWLVAWLSEQGHTVSGLSLDPVPGALFERADLASRMHSDERVDIRDATATADVIRRVSPDILIHLAAQPLVRESYRNPRLTFETNVNGTLNILEAVQRTPSVRAQLIITTDKVYRNVGKIEGYTEVEALGGADPYSASKAMADLLVQSWTTSFDGPPTAIARAGNVIGGGDVSVDRLLPDIVRSLATGSRPVLRNPDAIRPWQHVLDCLDGYLLLVDALLKGSGEGCWNFGPDASNFASVGEVASMAVNYWDAEAGWDVETDDSLHEAAVLTLDSAKARRELGWTDRLSLEEAVAWTIGWEKRVRADQGAADALNDQLAAFNDYARADE